MNILNFKQWVEDSVSDAAAALKNASDPNIARASQQANVAVQAAIKAKKNPLQAAQNAVVKAGIPTNKLGAVMPKDPDAQDDQS